MTGNGEELEGFEIPGFGFRAHRCKAQVMRRRGFECKGSEFHLYSAPANIKRHVPVKSDCFKNFRVNFATLN